MGLGLMTRSPIPRTGILRRAMSAADVFDRIESAVKSTGWAKEESLGRFLSFNRCSDPDKTPLLELLLHPSAEAVEFRVSEKRVVVSAKTSTVGPGYHAAVVSIIDEIGMAGFEWDWTEDDNSSGDETGYSTHRNFSRLQQSMAEFFGNLMKVVEEQVFDEYDGSAAVNVRMDSQRPTGMTGMVFPLGVRPRSWCVAAGESPSNYAMEFFAWWNAALDAPFWLKTGLGLMMVDVNWHPPASEKQRHVQTLAVLCFSRAKSLDPAIAVPHEELDELKRLLATNPNDAAPPLPSGIGFARLVCSQPLPAGWHIDLPGYFYFEQEPDGSVMWYFGERTIRVSIYSFKPKEGAAPDEEPFIPEDLRVRKQIGTMVYATKDAVPSEDEQGWLVCAVGAVPGKLAVITVAFVDRADEDWARRVSETIRPPGGIGG